MPAGTFTVTLDPHEVVGVEEGAPGKLTVRFQGGANSAVVAGDLVVLDEFSRTGPYAAAVSGGYPVELPTDVASGGDPDDSAVGFDLLWTNGDANVRAQFVGQPDGSTVLLSDLAAVETIPLAQSAANVAAAEAAAAAAAASAAEAATFDPDLFVGKGDLIFNAADYGAATGASASVNTGAIQDAIDAADSAGGGAVFIPPGAYNVAASTLSETFDNFGSSVSSDNGCLVLRKGVALIGAGAGISHLHCADATKTLIYEVAPEGNIIAGLELSSTWDPGEAGAGHGIIVYGTTGGDHACNRNVWRDLYIHNVGSYGIGLQNGYPRGCRIDNVVLDTTGADGIDLKARGTTAVTPSGNHMSNVTVRSHGRRVTGSAGVDVRGIWHLSSITVTDFGGDAALDFIGIRFRTKDDSANVWLGVGGKSSLTGFYVERLSGSSALSAHGLYSGSDEVQVANGQVVNCTHGVRLAGNAVGLPLRNRIHNVRSIDATEYGFYTGPGNEDTIFSNCYSSGSGTAGFRDEGTRTVLLGCGGAEATPLSTSGTAVLTQAVVACAFGADSQLAVTAPAAGRVQVSPRGSSTNIDLALSPKGTGVLRFGTHTANADAAITGYITVKDSGGTTRKLAIIT